MRKILQIHDADTAMPPLAFVKFFSFVVNAVRGSNLFAVEPTLRRRDWGSKWLVGGGWWPAARSRVFLIDPSDAFAKMGELFLTVAHASWDISPHSESSALNAARRFSTCVERRMVSSALTKFARLSSSLAISTSNEAICVSSWRVRS